MRVNQAHRGHVVPGKARLHLTAVAACGTASNCWRMANAQPPVEPNQYQAKAADAIRVSGFFDV